jgi:hypothetical protein
MNQHTSDRLGGRRLCARRNPGKPYVMCRAPDASFAAMSLTDVYATTNSLADALAEFADLFNLNGELVQIIEGKITPVRMNILPEIIYKHIATRELVNKGSKENPAWTVEYIPFVADGRTVRDLFSTERREGSLLARATRIYLPETPATTEPRRQQKVYQAPG